MLYQWLVAHLTLGGWLAATALVYFLGRRVMAAAGKDGVFTWLVNKFGGRHTLAVFAFFCTGNIFHYLHRLDTTYIYYMTVLMGFVLGHSAKEDAKDYFQRRDGQQGPPQIPPIPGQQ